MDAPDGQEDGVKASAGGSGRVWRCGRDACCQPRASVLWLRVSVLVVDKVAKGGRKVELLKGDGALIVLLGVLAVLVWHYTSSIHSSLTESVGLSYRQQLIQQASEHIGLVVQRNSQLVIAEAGLLGSSLIRGSLLSFSVLASQVEILNWNFFSSDPTTTTNGFIGRSGLLTGYQGLAHGAAQLFFSNVTHDPGGDFGGYISPAPSQGPLGGPSASPVELSAPASSSGLPLTSADESQAKAPQPASPPQPSYPPGTDYQYYTVDVNNATGAQEGQPKVNYTLDYRELNAYSYVIEADKGEAVHDVLFNIYLGVPELASLSPVYDVTGTYVGATLTGSSLQELTDSFDQLNFGDGGRLYLITDGNLLAAASGGVHGGWSNAELWQEWLYGFPTNAENASDPVLAGAVNLLFNISLVKPSQDIHLKDVLLGGRLCYIDSTYLTFGNLKMYAVLVMPREFIFPHTVGKHQAFIFLLATLIAAFIVAGCFVILLLSVRIRAERRLKAKSAEQVAKAEKAEILNQTKSTFLASMSHELRTPMAAILGLLDLVLFEDLQPEVKTRVEQIKAASSALLSLLNGILDLSKVEAGKMVLETAEFDIRQELETLVDIFSVQAFSKGTEIVLDFPSDMDRMVVGDAPKIRQIISNLLSNAVKFTLDGYIIMRCWEESVPVNAGSLQPAAVPASRGKAHKKANDSGTVHQELVNIDLELGLEQDLEKPGKGPLLAAMRPVMLVFELDDSGIGVPKEKRALIFESFAQADLKHQHVGTGLGLAIVKSLVQMMGGGINILDKGDGLQGTLFRFNIMLARPVQGAMRTLAAPHSERLWQPSRDERALRGGHVSLLVKNKPCSQVASRWLQRRGLHVTEMPDLKALLASRGAWGAAAAATGDDAGITQEHQQRELPSTSAAEPGVLDLLIVDTAAIPLSSSTGGTSGSMASSSPSPAASSSSTTASSTDRGSQVASMPQLLRLLRAQFVGGTLPSRRPAVIWLVAANTPASWRELLRRTGCGAIVCKPLHPSRMEQLLSIALAQHDLLNPTTASSSGQSLPAAQVEEEISLAASAAELPPQAVSQSGEGGGETGTTRAEPRQEERHLSSSAPAQEPRGKRGGFSTATASAVYQPPSDEVKMRGASFRPLDSSSENRRNSLDSSVGVGAMRPSLEKLAVSSPDVGTPTDSPHRPTETPTWAVDPFPHSLPEMSSSSGRGEGGLQRQLSDVSILRASTDAGNRLVGTTRLQSKESSTLTGVRLLLAEDVPVLKRLAIMLLEKLGARVVAVTNGQEAVDAVRASVKQEETSQTSSEQTSDASLAASAQAESSGKQHAFDLVLMDCQVI
eukprot:SM000022S07164  [mRNA]  locus=s22:333382:339594:+ [translate_table: standard]